jgi:hypothetical protein
MRERFELICKGVGLIVFCLGALWLLILLCGLLFGPPDITQMLPQAAVSRLSRSEIDQMQEPGSYVWRHALTVFLLPMSIASILGGLYLMQSNNLVVRLCYPQSGAAASPPPEVTGHTVGSAGSSRTPQSSETKPRDKYAPLGYFD